MGVLKPRTNLDRSLHRVPVAVQRTYLRLAKALFYACGFGLAVSALGNLSQIAWVSTIGYAIAAIGAGYGLQCWILMKALTGKRLDVSDDVITLDHGNGKVDMYAIADIEHVRLVWFPFVYSRFLLHMNDGRVLKFDNAMWERFDYVLDVVAHARPDLTTFPRYARFRNACIASDHYRSRLAEAMSLERFYALFAKAIAAPVIAGAIIMGLKMVGVGRDAFPPDNWVFANTFVFVAVLWPIWMSAPDVLILVSTMRRLDEDSSAVRRDRETEEIFDRSYGRHSWIAYAALIAITCLMCTIRLS